MPFTEVLVTCTETAPDGSPFTAGGSITFALNTELLDAITGKTYTRQLVVGRLNSAGVLIGADGNPGVKLVATDNVGVNPVGGTYRVVKNLNGVRPASPFNIGVPSGAPIVGGVPTIDLSAITPASTTGVSYVAIPGPPANPWFTDASLDTVAKAVVVTYYTPFGIHAGQPYCDPGNVTPGEEAVLLPDLTLIHPGT